MKESKKHCSLFWALLLLLEAAAHSSATTLKISPDVIKTSGDIIVVQWDGVADPSEADWLGLYSPPESPSDRWIGYFPVTDCSQWHTGSCTLQFPVTNLRQPYQVRLFSGSKTPQENAPPSATPIGDSHAGSATDDWGEPLPSAKHPLAVSNIVQFENSNEPNQVHLSLTEDPSEMRVMFVTRDPHIATVEWGPSEETVSSHKRGTLRATFDRSDMCDEPANSEAGWRDPGIIHETVMNGLLPRTRYFYRVGSKNNGWSKIFSFVSPALAEDETNAIIVGDAGVWAPYKTFRNLALKPEVQLTFAGIEREVRGFGDKPGFMALIGDLNYARGYSWLWDEWMTQIEPIASKIPFHVALGNHEYNWPGQPWRPDWAVGMTGSDGGGECGVPYSLRFRMPGNASGSTGTATPPLRNLWFSVDVGSVHFLTLSTEHDFLPGSAQLAFVEADLAAVDRRKTPFVVVMGHRPMYTSSRAHSEHALRERMVLHYEPLFVKYGVNLAIWAHVHRYERTCPIRNFTCAPGTGMGASLELTNSFAEGLGVNGYWGMGTPPSAHVTAETNPPQGGDSGSAEETEAGREIAAGSALPPIHVVCGVAGQDWQSPWENFHGHSRLPIYPPPYWIAYRSGQFGYCKIHATKDILTFSYIANHDGQVHDRVQLSANGGLIMEMLNGAEESEEERQVVTLFQLLLVTLLWATGCAGSFCLALWLVRNNYITVKPGQWQRVQTQETLPPVAL